MTVDKEDVDPAVIDNVDAIIENAIANDADIKRIQINETLNQAIRDGDAFIVDDGQVFISESFIRNGEKYGWKIGSLIPRWNTEPPKQEEKEVATHSTQVRISVETPESADEKLAAKIREVIRQEQQKGGMLWRW
jgi:hypothetical protein